MTKQIIQSLMKGVIKKKLEDIVFDIMEHPEEVPENIDEYVELARSMGFRDVLEGFDLIDSEIGKIQRQRTIEKRKNRRIRQEEREFQEYLISHPEKLQEIEQGLKYLSHEKVVRSGRLDIDTVDKEGNEVRVELKARDVDSRENFFQIMKYFKEDDSGKSRLVFVAPFIKPDLLFSLRDYQQAGRMKFFEYDKDNGNYTFKEIKPENIEQPQEIDWSKRKRKPTENGLVRVTAAVGKSGEKRIRKEEKSEEKETERKPVREDVERGWDSYPLYYQVLLMNRPHLKNSRKYLNAIEITRQKILNLEGLLEPDFFKESLSNFRGDIEKYTHPEKINALLKNPGIRFSTPRQSPLVEKAYDIGRMYDLKSKKIMAKAFFRIMNPKRLGETDPEEILKVFEGVSEELEELIKEGKNNETSSRFKMLLREEISKCKKDSKGKASKIYFENLLFLNGLYNEELTKNFLRLKTKRVRELLEIDGELAISYLLFSPLQTPDFQSKMHLYLRNLSQKGIKPEAVSESERLKFELIPPAMDQFIDEDNKLYQSILSHFRIKEATDWSKYPFYYQMMLLHDIAPEDRESYLGPTEVSEREMKQLEALKTSSDLEEKLSKYKEGGDFDEEHPREIDISKMKTGKIEVGTVREHLRRKKELDQGLSMWRETIDYFNKLTDEVLYSLSGYSKKLTIEELEKYSRSFNTILFEIDCGKNSKARNLRRVIELFEEEAIKEAKRQNDPFLEEFEKKYSRFRRERVLDSFLELKVARTKALEEIDENLAQAYLIYSVNTDEALKSQNKQALKPKESLAHVKIKPYIERDTQFYKSILENLVVAEEPTEIVTEAAKPEIVELEVKPSTQEKPEHIKTKVRYGYPASSVIPNRLYESLGKEKQAIVNEFVNGILNNPKYNNSIRKKYATLARESKWYSQNMDEKQVRDFFGNLTINIEEECHKSKGK